MPATGPLVFESSPRAMVWGGRALAERLDKRLPDQQAYGEAWEVSDHPRHASVSRCGPTRGRSLRSLMEHHATEIVGGKGAVVAIGNAPTSLFRLLEMLDESMEPHSEVHP